MPRTATHCTLHTQGGTATYEEQKKQRWTRIADQLLELGKTCVLCESGSDLVHFGLRFWPLFFFGLFLCFLWVLLHCFAQSPLSSECHVTMLLRGV